MNKLAAVLENDGEVAVHIPFSFDRPTFDYRHAYTQRRLRMTPEEFQERYKVMDGAAEAKTRMFDELGITEKDLNAAMQRAHSECAKYQSLRKLVQNYRKKRTLGAKICPNTPASVVLPNGLILRLADAHGLHCRQTEMRRNGKLVVLCDDCRVRLGYEW